jgi:hypothetical protein
MDFYPYICSMRSLIISFVLILFAQTLAYFQTQGQFFFTWAKEHPLIMSITGIPISILLIYFTKYCSMAFDGQVWPGRLIGFAVGAIVFALLSHFIMDEPFSAKTITCLFLAGGILGIQIFWK